MQKPVIEITAARRTPLESEWSKMYDYLAGKGYMLRPRYSPTWKPSWVETGRFSMDCEDWIMQKVWGLDATRKTDGSQVYIKKVDKREYPAEAEIAQFLSSEALRLDRYNHSVPILDSWCEVEPEVRYLVMQLLRPFNDPPFTKPREAADFVDQILQGLVFMHEHNVAHRDCSAQNIMMDARELYPNGWHPMSPELTRDAKNHVYPSKNRSDVNIRYFFIDFGLSTRFAPDEPHLVVGAKCATSAPELSCEVPYDPFKLDVYLLGKVFHEHICEKYGEVAFLEPLVKDVTALHPDDRPTALDALKTWQDISKYDSPSSIPWWLHTKGASAPEKLVEDVTPTAIYVFNKLTSL